jgi:hypothetical protein
MKSPIKSTMGLIAKNRFLGYRIQVFNQSNRSLVIFFHLVFALLYTSISLTVSSRAVLAKHHHIRHDDSLQKQLPDLPEKQSNQICPSGLTANKAENPTIFELANTSLDVSKWLVYPSMGVQELIQRYGHYIFTRLNISNINELDKYKLNLVLNTILGSPVSPLGHPGFNFSSPIERFKIDFDKIDFVLVTGGQPVTIHATSRYQVPEIVARSNIKAVAAVDGTFFSMKYIDSNTMIGPILSQSDHQFTPGNVSENKLIAGRPLVLLGQKDVVFMPFNPDLHNTLAGLQAEKPDVTDAFVSAAWLVRDGEAAPPESFKKLYGAEIWRRRAFWGITQFGTPIIGITTNYTDSANLAKLLVRLGVRNSVMLDGGGSTSLVYRKETFVNYSPRPVPQVIALVEPNAQNNDSCSLAMNK